MQQKYMAKIASRFAVPVAQIPLLPTEVQGLDTLAQLAEQVYGRVATQVNEA
mgnify:CR=1 FL=1